MKTNLLGMKYLKVATIVLLLTFTATHFSWAQENQNEDDILDLLPGILAAGNLSKDHDGDGYSERQGDCNDTNPAISPGSTEICGDDVDQDCSGADTLCPYDIDDDGDGYTENQDDCNDFDINTYPGATETCGDGVDQDCNGVDLLCPDDIDNDGDGYTENQGDCNDSIASINPGAIDLCGDGIDQDCNGEDQECVDIRTIAGTWYFSEDDGDYGIDEYYLVIDVYGAYTVYDYAGDTWDNWGNCYWEIPGRLYQEEGGRLREWSGSFEGGWFGTAAKISPSLAGNTLTFREENPYYYNNFYSYFGIRSSKNSFTPICTDEPF